MSLSRNGRQFILENAFLRREIEIDNGPTTTLYHVRPTGRIGALALLTCPVFFSGIVFSAVLRSDANVAGAMAANLLGAMCGGMLEYSSMRFGYPFLYLVAMALYATAAVAFLIARRGDMRLRT